MLLVVALPDQARLDTDSAAAWRLFDNSGAPLREGRGTLRDVPRAEQVVATVPANRIVFIETALPPVSADKREALVRYAIEDKLTIDPATVHAVVIGRADAGKALAHVVAAIDRRWFSGALEWLEAAGLSPRRVFAETEFVPVAEKQWSLVIGGQQGFAKRADGLAYSFDADFSGEPPFSLTLALQEAQKSGAAPAGLALYAADDEAAAKLNGALAERWANRLSIAVRLAGKLDAAESRASLAGGRGSREADLLIGEFAPKSAGLARLQTAKPVLIALSLIAAAHIVFTLGDWWRLERARQALQREMVQVFRDTFPQAQAIVDPALQMERNLDQLKRERGLAAADPARAALAQLAGIVRATPQLKIERVELRDGQAQLTGTLGDATAANGLRQQAARAGATLDIDAARIKLTIRERS